VNTNTPSGAFITHRMLYDQIRELGDEVERLRRENERLRMEAGRRSEDMRRRSRRLAGRRIGTVGDDKLTTNAQLSDGGALRSPGAEGTPQGPRSAR
jgi:hypothetical protein